MTCFFLSNFRKWILKLVLSNFLFINDYNVGVLLYQNLALKSSEQVRNAACVGECAIRRTGPLCPRDINCFLEAFREFQAQSEVVASSGNKT